MTSSPYVTWPTNLNLSSTLATVLSDSSRPRLPHSLPTRVTHSTLPFVGQIAPRRVTLLQHSSEPIQLAASPRQRVNPLDHPVQDLPLAVVSRFSAYADNRQEQNSPKIHLPHGTRTTYAVSRPSLPQPLPTTPIHAPSRPQPLMHLMLSRSRASFVLATLKTPVLAYHRLSSPQRHTASLHETSAAQPYLAARALHYAHTPHISRAAVRPPFVSNQSCTLACTPSVSTSPPLHRNLIRPPDALC